MITRKIAEAIQNSIVFYPIIALTGPRQSGKTTLLKHMFPGYRYVSLENPDNLEFAQNDPNGFLSLYDKMVIFDEVQRAPTLFSYLKTLVDASKIMGQFILSGSQNFNLMQKIGQSLAGRVALFKLLPFDFGELKEADLLPEDYPELLLRGGYPALFDQPIPTTNFYGNYVETYVERDVSDLLNIRDLGQFKLFLRLCAARAGQILNITELSKDAGISIPTLKSWLSILESSYLVYRLPPYFENFGKRLIKSAKIYFYDTGLLCFLLNIRDEEAILLSKQKGALFENFIINEYLKQNFHQNLYRDFYFWRDSNGLEIDLMFYNSPSKFDVVEIKSTKTVLPKLFKNLDVFERWSGGKVNQKILVYGGTETQNRTHHLVCAWNDVKIDFSGNPIREKY